MLVKTKVKQAINILQETGIDCWLTFVRETIEHNDPAMHLIAGYDVVWESAFIITKDGTRIAIVGQGDRENFESLGIYEVVTYVQSINNVLIATLDRINPKTIAINYSSSNAAADGLTHGMFLRLQQLLRKTDYSRRFVSAEPILTLLRGQKTSEEIQRIMTAAEETLELFNLFAQTIKRGWTARTVSEFMHSEMISRGVKSSWAWDSDPGVTTGPTMTEGHGIPPAVEILPGHVLRLDFGIKKDGYSSDLQRVWYVLRDGEMEPPSEIKRAFEVVKRGIDKAADALRPGVVGWEVDALVREWVIKNGYPEYMHALGHQVGIWAHDGGSVLGPRWERYGQRVYEPIQENQVFTLEFGVQTSEGYLALEEMVVVEQEGSRFLVPRQECVWLLSL